MENIKLSSAAAAGVANGPGLRLMALRFGCRIQGWLVHGREGREAR